MANNNQTVERAPVRRALIDKVFFGQKSAFKIQYNENADSAFFGIGKKDNEDNWTWRTAKMSDTELGDILRVLTGREDAVSFYHTFNKVETRIWINRKDNNVMVKIEDTVKLLTPAEQEIMRVLLEEIIRQTAMAA